MEITSLTNTKVKTWMKYHQKKYRDKEGFFLIEGEHLLQEAIKADVLVSLLIVKGKDNVFGWDKDVYTLSEDVMQKLSMNVSSVYYMGVCKKLASTLPNQHQRIILLDNVQDPGNLGTIVRSAYSFGYDAIIASPTCADLYNEKVIRSTQGALFHIPYLVGDLQEAITTLQKDDYSVYATALQDAISLSDVKNEGKIAFVLGNEGNGVSNEVLAICNQNIKIEMANFESLNVAVAGGICMYYFRNN